MNNIKTEKAALDPAKNARAAGNHEAATPKRHFDYIRTSEAVKDAADRIIERILDGATVKVSCRDNNDYLQRLVRAKISEARQSGIPILVTTEGYRLAGPDDKDEVDRLVASMMHRANEIMDAAMGMAHGYKFDYMEVHNG